MNQLTQSPMTPFAHSPLIGDPKGAPPPDGPHQSTLFHELHHPGRRYAPPLFVGSHQEVKHVWRGVRCGAARGGRGKRTVVSCMTGHRRQSSRKKQTRLRGCSDKAFRIGICLHTAPTALGGCGGGRGGGRASARTLLALVPLRTVQTHTKLQPAHVKQEDCCCRPIIASQL